MNKILVCGDIHGRTFWKKVIESDLPVIFLGDYTDPYPQEEISKKQTLDNFKEVIEFANDQKDRVTLLLGNHDCQMLGYSPSYKKNAYVAKYTMKHVLYQCKGKKKPLYTADIICKYPLYIVVTLSYETIPMALYC